MHIGTAPRWSLGFGLGAALAFGPVVAAPAYAQGAAVALAAHRAVYDLTLSTTRGKRSMNAVHGRILYDFSGSACEGYALQFRQVSEMDSGEGKSVVSDLRATSWEDGSARKLRFHSQNYFDEKLREKVDGEAERSDQGIAIQLTEPAEKKVGLTPDLVFPTEHVRRVLAAARADQTLLQVSVYDGSDGGEKLYDTLTVIGKAIAPAEQKADDATGDTADFAQLMRWPVTISYFDHAGSTEKNGEQTPIYSITFEMYENGVSRALVLDYGDFVLKGRMTSLEMRPVKACE